MNSTRPFGVAVFALGAVLLGIGYDMTQGSPGRLSAALGGGYTDGTIAFIICGIVTVVSGGFLTVFVKRM